MSCRLQANSCVAETLDDEKWFRVGRPDWGLGAGAKGWGLETGDWGLGTSD